MSASPWLGGQRVTAERLAEMLPKYSNWTPTWTTTTGVNIPTFGNASINCRYAVCGDLVVANMYIIFGSTTNFGGGGAGDDWLFSLPVNAAALTVAAGSGWQGPNVDIRSSLAPSIVNSTQFCFENTAGNANGSTVQNGGRIDLTTPFNWSNGSTLQCVMQYEKA